MTARLECIDCCGRKAIVIFSKTNSKQTCTVEHRGSSVLIHEPGHYGSKLVAMGQNAEAVACLFATYNLLKLKGGRKVLSPYCNMHAVTSKLSAHPTLATVQDH